MLTPCPTPDKLLGFASGELSDDQSASVEAHIDDCSECRAALSNVARGDVPPAFGRYRLDTVLGSGGMGIVYRAYDPQLARAVAIKVVKRAAEDATGRARLIREAQALARLSHPNVCHVYDVGTQDDEVWVAMELIDGVSLREWAAERPDDLLAVLLGAAEGIHAAHEAGLVHRDIKPENVLVTRDGRAIVTDFGLARGEDKIDPNASTLSTDPHLTATGAIAGTPAYLAPEQLTGDPIDARVDQFAWAVMAWELLTGSKPFPIIFALRIDAVRAGVTPPPSLRKPVAAALARAMSVSPRDRFPTVRDAVEAIRGPQKPIVPARSRAAAVAGIGVLAATAGAIAIWKWPRSHVTQTRDDAAAVAVVQPEKPVAPPQPIAAPDAALAAPVDAAAPSGPAPVVKSSDRTVAKGPAKTDRGKPIAPAPVPAPPVAAPAKSPPVRPIVPSMVGSRGQPRRGNAIATMDQFCHLPYDPAHPDPATGKPIVDWGTVTKVGDETGSLNEESLTETIITLQGARGVYRFKAESGSLGTRVPAAAGDMLAVCWDREESDIYSLQGGPIIPMESVVTISAPPLITTLADLKPLHISDITLAASGSSGHSGLATNRRYLVWATVGEEDGNRWKMDRYWMEVAPGAHGAKLLGAHKRLWLVVENPHFEEAGGTKQFVVRAVAVLEDMFPG